MKRFAWRLQKVLDVKTKEEQLKRNELFRLTEQLAARRSELLMRQRILQDLMADMARRGGSDDIRIFCRENLETYICIVLFHSGKKTQTGGSPLVLRIVTEFQAVGLVHHTIWNEMAQ